MQMRKILPVLACALVSSPTLALNIVFDYDANSSFFTDERRDALERAALVYENYITNDLNVFVALDSVVETEGLAWGGTSTIANFQRDWNGTITFNESYSWYSGTAESFSGFDLFSVALHELGHVFGVGIVDTWDVHVLNGSFYGQNAVGVYGNPVPVDALGGHWLDGVMSTLPGTETWRLVNYSPYISSGERQYLTDLDLAGLRDIGWSIPSVIPEPATLYLLLSGLGVVGFARRRQRISAA
ncbi:MAG: PEP-CTERM sorting domain-containing protein [Azoarcus sp.]|jgi:hypothetical protein|nr:PEP-CTERM sorting domain-containing protein [Azoarcus sp.]